MFLFLLGSTLSSNITAVQASPPKPVGDPGEWVTPDDYPKSALVQSAEGVTGFGLLVGPDGKVVDCEVMRSSGNEALDAVACAVLRDRAHFTPARDEHGKVTIGTYSSAVRWQIPAIDPMPLKAFSASLVFDVNAAGATSGCKVEGNLPEGANLNALCHAVLTKASFQPFRDKDGTARPKHVVVRFSLDVQDVVAKSPAGLGKVSSAN